MSASPQIVRERSGISDGAQDSTTPLVGCAQAITFRPPAGGVPGGMKIAPETSIGSPFSPVERYRMRNAVLPAPLGPPPSSGQTLTIDPGPESAALARVAGKARAKSQ
jgi:hypothetical protein